jgi:hypothetical protein
MVGFKQFLEALDLKTVKELKLTRKSSKAYSSPKLNEIFNGKDRIIIDSDFRALEAGIPPTTFRYVQKALDSIGYTITLAGYVDNVAWKVADINKKQPFKIGKLLQKHSPSLVEAFKKDKIREFKSDMVYKMVISRHPYDVAGMSTGRKWVSCTELPQKSNNNERVGAYCHLVANAVQEGALIAYLTPLSDTNLTRPISRILLVPHIGSEGDVVYSVGQTYGAKHNHFEKVVFDWVSKNLNNDQKSDVYFHPPNVYNDLSLVNFNRVPWTKQVFKHLLDNKHPNIKFQYYEDRISFLINFDLSGKSEIDMVWVSRSPHLFSNQIKKIIPLNISVVKFTDNECLAYGEIFMPSQDMAKSGTKLEDMYKWGANQIKESGLLEFDYDETLKRIVNRLKQDLTS